MMRFFLFLSLFFSLLRISSQTEDAWVYFTDKPDAKYYINNPLEMLSERAIERRVTQKISLDKKDVPIATNYIDKIKNTKGITVLAKSKWLNSLHIQGLPSDINALTAFTFVDRVEYANKSLKTNRVNSVKLENGHTNKWDIQTDFDYGLAANQIEMLKGDFLHENNFTGAGMQIAVIDSGFINVDEMDAFERIRSNNQILGTYDFVHRTTDVYGVHYHGTMVLSSMAGYIENEFAGTAPDAGYYLFISEDVSREHPVEESLWVEAAEKADSLGVDVVNTSLGYTTFDRAAYNHSYEDMDGKTTFISRGAEIAFTRGMLIITSAGNSGHDAWHYIGAPADVASTLSIGAVDANGNMAGFSSYGPTSDGRVKPDVCAQGDSAVLIDENNSIVASDGTSFSSPILSGVAACLWQAFPNKTNVEIADVIRQSAHLFNAPENQYGYGIPNFKAIYTNLKNGENPVEDILVYPNPVENESLLFVRTPEKLQLDELMIFDILGKIVYHKQDNIPYSFRVPFADGLYIIHLKTAMGVYTDKLIIK